MQQDTHDQLRARQIELLTQEVSRFSDPHTREVVQELLETLLDMYGEGLARILELTRLAKVPGFELIKTFADDELIGALLLLHDLHPVDIKTRVMRALNEVRPYLKSHGGNVEFVKAEAGVVYLRLEGSCHGCAASAITLKQTIEEAIYRAAPDLQGIEVEGVTEPPPRVTSKPVTFVPTRRKREDLPLTAPGKG
ncbi:MAG TPA: NifU family protein [Ktedonobacteraceae bacterium]